jgi:hypothetical protein
LKDGDFGQVSLLAILKKEVQKERASLPGLTFSRGNTFGD